MDLKEDKAVSRWHRRARWRESESSVLLGSYNYSYCTVIRSLAAHIGEAC